ncbi:MAG TPA: nicotinate phosphoribosyltransferase [Anaerovoracaceae bacterium]|nr:nicotinate phosphoribosyltransferase [Anaerovoracaceae bacterium]
MIYNDSLATLTDLYQLTMAYGYWKNKCHEEQAHFNLFFRKAPAGGNFAIAAGLGPVISLLSNYGFTEGDIVYLSTLKSSNGSPLFEKDFLDYLFYMEFNCSVSAVPEGTVVFPNEPLLTISGPIIQCQLLETALLNIINFQTLIATKAAHIMKAANGDKVSEFGLRRAQGIDGGLAASRAAFIGGCDSTSNTMAGKIYGIPVVGTHAHSWVMSFDSELEAFRAYASAMPDNCVFLVDTYNVEQGVRNAIIVGQELRKTGHEMKGIRLDSGDLAKLSIMARKMLDEAGFPNCKIVASNDLDENAIIDLKAKGARIDMWGIGTKLVTSYDQPALGGVYKLGAIKTGFGWERKIKLSADKEKVTNPGKLNVLRYFDENGFLGDKIIDTIDPEAYHDSDPIITPEGAVQISSSIHSEILLYDVFIDGKLNFPIPSIFDAQKRTKEQIAKFDFDKKCAVGVSTWVEFFKQKLMRKMNHD